MLFCRHQNALSGRQGNTDDIDAGILFPLLFGLHLLLLHFLRDQSRGVDQVAGLLLLHQVQAFHGAVINLFKGGFFLFLAGNKSSIFHRVHSRGFLHQFHRHFFDLFCPFPDKVAKTFKTCRYLPVRYGGFYLHTFIGVVLLQSDFIPHLFDGGIG